MLPYTVIIPARDAELYLPACLESIQRQSVPPAEIILIDDGSTDRTVAIAAAAGARVSSNPVALGPAASRNLGVSLATTPLVAFLDADDEWRSDHAQLLLGAFDAPGTVFCGSDADKFGSETGLITAPIISGQPVDVSDALLLDNPIIQSTVIVRRDAFLAVGGYDETLSVSEDYDLWSRLSERGQFFYVSEATVRRRMHTAQLTRQYAAQFMRNSWLIRRRVLARRLGKASAERRAHAFDILKVAATRELEWAVWVGRPPVLRAVREELERTDAEFGFGGRLAALGGADSFKRHWTISLQCAARMPLQLFREAR